jgi:hypothetical protein
MPGFSHGTVGGMLELSYWWKSCLGLVMGLLGGCLSLVIGWEYGYTAGHYNPRIDTRPHVKHFEFY